MNQQCLYDWIKHPEKLNRETLYELRTLLARYPYFQTARLLYLKNLFLLHDISFGEELRRSALYITDRKILFYLVEGDRYDLKSLQKQEQFEAAPGLDRTLSLIDAFLATIPESETSKEPALPIEIAVDYTSYLLQEESIEENKETQSSLQGQELIDSFLNNSEDASSFVMKEDEAEVDQEENEIEEESDEILDDESYFTETLAKIYVKQQRYSKALEIIRKLNLNYPKKNAYFADQIRFLEKLIINAKSK